MFLALGRFLMPIRTIEQCNIKSHRTHNVSIGQEAGHNIGQDRGRERLPDEGDLQLPRMCDDWS